MIVPYFRSKWAFIDPTHIHFFTVDSFSYFGPEHIHNRLYNYSRATFSVEKIVLNENIEWGRIIDWLVRFANRHLHFYEQYISPLFPLGDITYYLNVLK